MKCKKCKVKMRHIIEWVDDNKGNTGECEYYRCDKCGKLKFPKYDVRAL